MRKSLVGLLCTIALLHSSHYDSKAIVGYVNQPWTADVYHLINSPLDDGTNTVVSLFGYAPDGTTVSLWDATLNAYSVTSEKIGGNWSVDLDLQPGTGALLYSPVDYTNTYVGEVVFDGGSTNYIDFGEGYFYLPVPPAEPGLHLLGVVAPFGLTGTDVFLYAVGRAPETFESVWTLDPLTGNLNKHTYFGGSWDTAPSLSVAESAFFDIGGTGAIPYVPEPTTFTLLGLGSLALVLARLRR